MKTGADTSIRQLARLIGVTEKAVRKARTAGVFSDQAISRDDVTGAPVVRDLNLAVAQWERSGRRLRGSVRQQQPASKAAPTPESAARAADMTGELLEDGDDAGDEAGDVESKGGQPPGSLVNAQTMAMLERARKLRLENEEREGNLLDVAKVRKEAFEFARVLRESILNVPARIGAELAAESDPSRVFARLDAALREALEATAAGMEVTDGVR